MGWEVWLHRVWCWCLISGMRDVFLFFHACESQAYIRQRWDGNERSIQWGKVLAIVQKIESPFMADCQMLFLDSTFARNRIPLALPSGNLTWLLKIAIYSGFTNWKWWLSIVILNYQRGTNCGFDSIRVPSAPPRRRTWICSDRQKMGRHVLRRSRCCDQISPVHIDTLW